MTIAYNNVLNSITTNLATGSNITAVELRSVEQALLDFAEAQWLTGDVKEIDCDSAYILNNFEPSGLGKNEREGWAICNGDNGTKNRTGRVPVGYGATGTDVNGASIAQTSIGSTGGEKDHTLSISEMPVHNHSLTTIRVNTNAFGGVAFYDRGSGGTNTQVTDNKGGGGAHNNMQPYIVTLFIQKL